MSIEHDEKRNAKLEAEANRLGMPPWQLEAARAVGTDLIGDIVRDNRRGHGLKPETSAAAAQPTQSTRGWVEPPAVADWTPPGQRQLDRMMDAQDARDRAERQRELATIGRQRQIDAAWQRSLDTKADAEADTETRSFHRGPNDPDRRG